MPILTLPQGEKLSLSVRAKALVFEDGKSRALLGRIQQVAPSNATVLIAGETGTGKEIVARHIHDLSNRSNRPFVAVNCGAFSESLIESDLFGHEKGAFTGAASGKAGWFEAADGGTLFLDEIGDLPLGAQVKLLRVLQEQEVVRLGSRTPIPVDVRLIAATNVRLEEAVAAGHFREDLFYRLAVAKVAVAPLRERPGDILPLARYFLNVYAGKLGTGRPRAGAEPARGAEPSSPRLDGKHPRARERHSPRAAGLPRATRSRRTTCRSSPCPRADPAAPSHRWRSLCRPCSSRRRPRRPPRPIRATSSAPR